MHQEFPLPELPEDAFQAEEMTEQNVEKIFSVSH